MRVGRTTFAELGGVVFSLSLRSRLLSPARDDSSLENTAVKLLRILNSWEYCWLSFSHGRPDSFAGWLSNSLSGSFFLLFSLSNRQLRSFENTRKGSKIICKTHGTMYGAIKQFHWLLNFVVQLQRQCRVQELSSPLYEACRLLTSGISAAVE